MIDILSILIGISILVVIIGVAILIWKNRNLSILKKAAITITLASSMDLATASSSG